MLCGSWGWVTGRIQFPPGALSRPHLCLSGCIFGALNHLVKSPALEVTMLERPCGKTAKTERERGGQGAPAIQPPDVWLFPAWTTSQVNEQVIGWSQPSLQVFQLRQRPAILLIRVQIPDPQTPEHNKRSFSPLSLGVGYYIDTVIGTFTQGDKILHPT